MEKKNRQKRMFTLSVARAITSVILLAFFALAWYGAEMLLYGYSQPSIVKAIVAVWLVMLITGRLKREMIINDAVQEIERRFHERKNTEARPSGDGGSGDSCE